MPLPVIPIERPFLPELLPEVQQRIKELLPANATVFEFGSGASTAWFAEFVSKIVTVEHEPLWANVLYLALSVTRLSHKVEVIQVGNAAQIPAVIDAYDLFDMVFVDCLSGYRQDAILKAWPHVKPGGYLVADDSHWGGVNTALANIDWPREDISGMHTRKTGKVRFHQTSFLRRPGNGKFS